MTDKEKRDNQELYDANYNEDLINEMKAAKDICFQYNNINPLDREKREKIIKKLFGGTGEHVLVESNFYCDYGYNIYVGENFYMNHNCVILDGAKVEFGDNVFIGPNCGFYTAGHPIEIELRNAGLEYAKPIRVGDNVWFGGNVVVLPGGTIGNNVTIGAGSIVTKDIPDGCIAYGNPCKVVRKI
ncbi:MAG: sugar O-acetyltransferase [Clostridia bacterium]|jgi:acetyltransferase-like isoleucine patch superfamily enzyme|nr:sugar O-acetyltransferase [Clostridia bacterium]